MSKPHRGRIGVAESDKNYYIGFWKEDADKHPKGERLIGYDPKVLGGLAMTDVRIDAVVLQNNKVMAVRVPKANVLKNADAESVENFFREVTLNQVSKSFTGLRAGGNLLIEPVDATNVDNKFTGFESYQKFLEDASQVGDQ